MTRFLLGVAVVVFLLACLMLADGLVHSLSGGLQQWQIP